MKDELSNTFVCTHLVDAVAVSTDTVECTDQDAAIDFFFLAQKMFSRQGYVSMLSGGATVYTNYAKKDGVYTDKLTVTMYKRYDPKTKVHLELYTRF